jgi:hypothetical protein
VVSLDDLDEFPSMRGAPVLMPLRRRLEVRAFGINCWTAPVGAPAIERHSEPDGDDHIAFAQAYARGEQDARALLAEEFDRHPDAWQPAYNAACFEALTGNADAAFEHLARAFALGPARVRKLAADGEDFATLRSDPRWQELLDT